MPKIIYGKLIDNSVIMLEWDWTKNNIEGLNPMQLTEGSSKLAWWKCSVCHNDWSSTVYDRTQKARKCPYCKKMLSHYRGRSYKSIGKLTHKPSNRVRHIGLDK